MVASACSGTARAEPSSATDALCFSRRHLLHGLAVSGVASVLAPIPPALAKGAKEEKAPTVVNDPVALKAQIEAQYRQWASGQSDTWLAGQPETIKWQSTYNGTPVKLKGKAGAAQYFAMLKADLDIQSYKPLAIFVDNDGDEATVVVEASGFSRRTQAPFTTIFLHQYTIGPMGQVLKFKEVTDTALMAQLVPSEAAPTAAGAETGESSVEPGSAARSV
ncbi:hypothetical protein GPECTOR_1g215 [Gonium pectorale]|uniref:SnoaL-like domain-containing protein n=1 Tax=Gonium pectorale TaxID=33097 RepID=A0A150H268_GONPE|nr:hypothetical protein GPECTOR_1g215 [Gonium pectorale]|eukprot:KXZ56247.1 hypothetical protein GPECTOR_1g215 [Gonium pectorale]